MLNLIRKFRQSSIISQELGYVSENFENFDELQLILQYFKYNPV